ncbi:MAG: hypothetical protein RSB77_07280 [Bacilli bacterium]
MYNDYDNNASNKEIIINNFKKLIKNYTYLNKILVWWDTYVKSKPGFRIRKNGIILPQMNTNR